MLRLAGMRFGDSFLFAGIGFGARKPKNERFFGMDIAFSGRGSRIDGG